MPTKCFGTVRPKIFDWKSWYSLLPPPPLLSIIFFDTRFFWYTDQKGSPTKFFSTETKKIDTKSWDKSLKHKIFRYPKLVIHWRVPLRNFSALWDRHFLTENRDTPSSPPPLIHKFFRYQNFPETKKGSSTKYFRYCETTIFFIENRDIPLLGIKFFDTRNFLRHRRFPQRNFSELWDEKFSTENRDTLLYKVHKSVVELMFVRTFWELISKQ